MAGIKSKMAAQFTIQDMKTNLYMWTLTFAETIDVEEGIRRWRVFLSGSGKRAGLVKCFPYMSGIRVFEMHPGRQKGPDGERLSHGLHVHMIVNDFLAVDIVRKLATEAGFGRVHAVKIAQDHAGYVAKYLCKSRDECFRGRRLWAPIGFCESHKVRDIVCDTRWTATYQLIAASTKGWAQIPWNERIYITSRVLGGESLERAMRKGGRNIFLHEDYEKLLAQEEGDKEEFHADFEEYPNLD